MSIASSTTVRNSDSGAGPDPWELPYGDWSVRIIPTLINNYAYVLIHGQQASVVDPGEAAPVLNFLRARALVLNDIWITHGHHDHLDGVPELVAHTGARVIAPAGLPLARVDHVVGEGDSFTWGGRMVKVWSTPGHQKIHVAYLIDAPAPGLAFIGDILFGAGCGRLFGLPPEILFQTLQRLQQLPDRCALFCGHELTRENLSFACALEPDNPALHERRLRVNVLRAHGEPTVPLHLDEERSSNPFLRPGDPGLQAALGLAGSDPVTVFAALRDRKDVF